MSHMAGKGDITTPEMKVVIECRAAVEVFDQRRREVLHRFYEAVRHAHTSGGGQHSYNQIARATDLCRNRIIQIVTGRDRDK